MKDSAPPPAPIWFASPAAFRAWLEAHYEAERELWVGYHRKATGRPSMSWSESVDVALCFGWIDGVRRRVDQERYAIRFTPRKAGSRWSAVNVGKMAELTRLGLVHPAGERAFAARQAEGGGTYSYEDREEARLEPAEVRTFRADGAAWAWFQARPPGYRRAALFWVVSAKRPGTRAKRLATLIADSGAARPIAPLARR